jgi:hypothetical protein
VGAKDLWCKVSLPAQSVPLEILALAFSFGVVTPIATIGFIVFYWSRVRGDDRIIDAWRGYARRRRVTFGEPVGTWPNRTSPTVRWNEGGTAYRIEGQGKEKITRTCVVARPAVAVLGEFSVTLPDGEAAARDGAKPFGHLVVWSRPADLADRVLTAPVKRALLGFDATSLFYRDGEVSLRWPGGEENDARLDEASAVVRRVLAALDAAHHDAAPDRQLRSARASSASPA